MLRQKLTNSIWRAAIIELAREGYARLTMEGVTRRAGVGKAALYRRWPGKEDMIIEILLQSKLVIIAAPNTGSLESDVNQYLREAVRILNRPLFKKILPDLYSEMTRDTRLGKIIQEQVQEPKSKVINQIINQAVSREEMVAGADYLLAYDLLAGPLYWHMLVNQEPMDDEFMGKLVKIITTALKSC
ncbi:MAG: TetR/AcrR family transcriptional regulator [Alphaproteobacteria bacterium]|nr:TetR/AcrR family transcriptional regulator [Alphaproteobacteria bacterium]